MRHEGGASEARVRRVRALPQKAFKRPGGCAAEQMLTWCKRRLQHGSYKDTDRVAYQKCSMPSRLLRIGQLVSM